MRPKDAPACAVNQRDGFANFELSLRRGGCAIVIRTAGSRLAQRACDAVDFQVVNLAQGVQGRCQFGVLGVEAVAKQVRLAPVELGRQLNTRKTSHAAFLERLAKTRQAFDAVMVGQGGVAHSRRSKAGCQCLGRLVAVAENRMAVEVDENRIVHESNFNNRELRQLARISFSHPR